LTPGKTRGLYTVPDAGDPILLTSVGANLLTAVGAMLLTLVGAIRLMISVRAS
jgi:hypothetical protein